MHSWCVQKLVAQLNGIANHHALKVFTSLKISPNPILFVVIKKRVEFSIIYFQLISNLDLVRV